MGSWTLLSDKLDQNPLQISLCCPLEQGWIGLRSVQESWRQLPDKIHHGILIFYVLCFCFWFSQCYSNLFIVILISVLFLLQLGIYSPEFQLCNFNFSLSFFWFLITFSLLTNYFPVKFILLALYRPARCCDKPRAILDKRISSDGTLSKDHKRNTGSKRAKMIPCLRTGPQKPHPIWRHIFISLICESTRGRGVSRLRWEHG